LGGDDVVIGSKRNFQKKGVPSDNHTFAGESSVTGLENTSQKRKEGSWGLLVKKKAGVRERGWGKRGGKSRRKHCQVVGGPCRRTELGVGNSATTGIEGRGSRGQVEMKAGNARDRQGISKVGFQAHEERGVG